MEIFQVAGDYVAVGAALGVLFLVPLLLSQRRDLQRLAAWMEEVPDHPTVDLLASEEILDRSEAELEDLLTERGESFEIPAETAAAVEERAAATGELSPVERVTQDRPALARVTAEFETVHPLPRWRLLLARFSRPRTLALVALASAAIGLAVIYGFETILSSGGGGEPDPVAEGAPSDTPVAVLNATAVSGLGAKVADDVSVNGFTLGEVASSPKAFVQSLVMFEEGSEETARAVAKTLGVKVVKPMDPRVREAVAGAEVVVIAGLDRARA